eukprot:6170699-Pleurochrysis_carterae.AAC.4
MKKFDHFMQPFAQASLGSFRDTSFAAAGENGEREGACERNEEELARTKECRGLNLQRTGACRCEPTSAGSPGRNNKQ